MLDCKREADSRFNLNAMLDAWETAPDAQIRIHPLIREFYVWGLQVPASTVRARHEQLKKQGLEWIDHKDLARVRAAGGPLTCHEEDDRDARTRLLESALLLGGGYVELSKGRTVLSTCFRRPVRLDQGLVGPYSAVALDFDRHSARSRCPCYKGRGQVASYNTDLVLGDSRKPLESSHFLHPGGIAALKGVYRNSLWPFFRRMMKEGLWPENRPVAELSRREQEVLLYGFWSRPGPGSFLRTPKSNPKEVASWLRWDGLFSHIRDNVSRGPAQWGKAILASERMIDCPACNGTGLRSYVSLFEFAGRSYANWLESGTLSELYRTLKKEVVQSGRSRRRQARLTEVLAPFATGKSGSMKLRDPVTDGDWQNLIIAITEAFTNLSVLTEEDA